MSGFTDDSARKIEIISQGTYGCIFKPGMNCKGEIEKKGYITKLQYDQETTQNEVNIGKILLEKDVSINMSKKEQRKYDERFAPILHSCPVMIGQERREDFIEKCKVIKDNSSKNIFSSNKIRYVGKYTLFDYFSMLIREPNKSKFIGYCIRFHKYLLESASILKEKKIIHFDLKENNILIDEKQNIPVIIDFGLSINMKLLLQEPMNSYLYTKTFFTYYDKYPPWCLEIILISFIVNNVPVDSIWGGAKDKFDPRTKMQEKKKENAIDWTSRIVKKEDLLSIIDHFFENNPLIIMISLDTRENYKTQWKNWIQSIYMEKRSTIHGIFMVKKLIHSWTSWDTFGLSVIFFILLYKFTPNHFLGYKHILVGNILAIPTEREIPEVFQKKLSDYFHSLDATKEKAEWIGYNPRSKSKLPVTL